MPATPRYRTSAKYGKFYAGAASPLRFKVETWNPVTKAWDPTDLTAFDSVRFRAFATDSASSLLWNIALTVKTDAAYRVPATAGGTACRAWGSVTFAAAASDVRCQLVLVTGSTYEVVDSQWLADVYVGGPTS